MLLLNEMLKVTCCWETWAVECRSEPELLMVLLGTISLTVMYLYGIFDYYVSFVWNQFLPTLC